MRGGSAVDSEEIANVDLFLLPSQMTVQLSPSFCFGEAALEVDFTVR